MRNFRIYHPEQFDTGQSVTLDKTASNHLIRVLRLKDGQIFSLFNGDGCEYTAILKISGKKAIANIQSFSKTANESPLKTHLLQGVSKGERMDFVIQKSIELGVNKITPLICERTVINLKGERLQKKQQHWKNIAISACEQSGRNYLPEITAACNFSSLADISKYSLKILLDPLSGNSMHSLTPEHNQLTILIGPEGGLSEAEISQACAHGYTRISMGPRILRTETAALSAITMAQLLWGDMG